MEQTETPRAVEHIAADLRPLARAVARLHEDPKNARVHGDQNMGAIEASLRAHGQRKPIVVKNGAVLAGNGTLRVARKLGWEWIACVEYEGPEALARAFAIADNRSAEQATWDPELLALALRDADGAGLLDATAFDRVGADEALGAALAAAPQCEDPGAEEPPANPVSKLGELYELGPHRLLCGDSTSAVDVTRLMGDQKAALCATDPPYLVDYTGADRPDNSGKDWSSVYREVEIKDAANFFRSTFKSVLSVLAEHGAIYCWHASKRQGLISGIWAELGILEHQQIIWVKPTSVFGHVFWHYRHEPCLMGWVQGSKPPHDGGHADTSVWELDYDGKSRQVGNEHPTQKPLEIFARPIRKHTRPGDIVFEPFSGSGSQLIAAAKLGRRCYGLEISPAFCDVVRRRWTKYARSTGLQAGPGGLE